MEEVRKMDKKVELYHGSGQIVEFPEIRKTRYTKDFSWGFYCTKSYEQAYRWAERKHKHGIINVYSYTENKQLKINRHSPYLSITLHKCYPYYLFGISTFPNSAYHTTARRKFSITIV